MSNKGLIESKLMSAVRAGHLWSVVDALNEGADIEEPDIHGSSGLPLRTACFDGNLALVRELLTRGANPNAPASDGPGAPLRLALRRGHEDVAALLLQHGATQSPETGIARIAATPAASVGSCTPDIGNLIEFTPSQVLFAASTDDHDTDTSTDFGTETKALAADLLFLEETEHSPTLPAKDPARR